MTIREKFEVALFGSAIVIGLPAAMAASLAIAG